MSEAKSGDKPLPYRSRISFRSLRGYCLRRSGLLSLVLEERYDVAMAFQHVHDLQCIADIAEKDHVIPVRMAAQIETQFRARPAPSGSARGRDRGTCCEAPRQSARQHCGCRALVCNVFGDCIEVV